MIIISTERKQRIDSPDLYVPIDGYVTVIDVSRELGCSEYNARRLLEKSGASRFKLPSGGKRVYYDKAAFDSFMRTPIRIDA